LSLRNASKSDGSCGSLKSFKPKEDNFSIVTADYGFLSIKFKDFDSFGFSTSRENDFLAT